MTINEFQRAKKIESLHQKLLDVRDVYAEIVPLLASGDAEDLVTIEWNGKKIMLLKNDFRQAIIDADQKAEAKIDELITEFAAI